MSWLLQIRPTCRLNASPWCDCMRLASNRRDNQLAWQACDVAACPRTEQAITVRETSQINGVHQKIGSTGTLMRGVPLQLAFLTALTSLSLQNVGARGPRGMRVHGKAGGAGEPRLAWDWVPHAVPGADVGWPASQAERYDEMVRFRRGARTLPSRPLAHLAQLYGPQAPPAVSYALC